MESKTTYLAIEGHADNWEEAIRLCGKSLVATGNVGEHFTEACLERETDYPTGIPADIPVAIPHGASDTILENTVCFLRTDTPVNFARMDDDEETIDTQLIFNIAVKPGDNHLDFLQSFMEFVTDEEALKQCLSLPINEMPSFLEARLP